MMVLADQDPIIFGIDLSANHWAVCQIDYTSGECVDYRYMTTKKGEIIEITERFIPGLLLKEQMKKSGESKDNYAERRKAFSAHKLYNFIINKYFISQNENIYICIEGYAHAASSRGMTQIAEVTGVLKTMLYDAGINLRIYAPTSVKLYATGKGNCLKKDMVTRAGECGFVISDSLITKTIKNIRGVKLNCDDPSLPQLIIEKKAMMIKRKKGIDYYVADKLEEYDGVGTDLADAFFLGRILRTELMLRAGVEKLEDLSESERGIFLRTTSAYPENILSRPFIKKELTNA